MFIAVSSSLSYSAALQQPPPPSTSLIKVIPTSVPLVNPDGSFTIFSWKNTKSSLTNKPFVGRVPPDTSSPNSLFIDRKANNISDNAIKSYFRNDLLGVAFFPADRFLQLTFKDANTYEKYLSLSSVIINDKRIYFTPPKSVPRRSIVVHLHGLPIMPRDTITNAITNALSPHCTVKEIAPVLISDTDFLTPKWDAVVELIPDKKIPVHLTILNSSIALTFLNSASICLYCHKQDHMNSNCPLRPHPRPNPRKTYAAFTNSQNKSSTNTNPNVSQATMNIDPQSSATTVTSISQNSLQSSIHAPKTQMSNESDKQDHITNDLPSLSSSPLSNMSDNINTDTNASSQDNSMEIETEKVEDNQTYETTNHRSKLRSSRHTNPHSSSSSPYPTNTNHSSQNKQ
ncbi:2672_t:CDS:2 [Paraglomus occultum]|uniref:2672_t:CDS:1 n=1 Tax=Paraglomus occultum TaxID=144539 RepID=A0A9N8WDZ1_9GLOM|nr:2672_t:CDS:2 [Paraglomus occultum]